MRRIRAAGLMEPRPAYYITRTAVAVVALVAGWAAFFALGQTWWQVLTAVFLGVVFPQFAYLGHDSGHRQIFRTRRANYLFGLFVGNVVVGMSIGWWTGNHNRHHAHPNTEGSDPDITGVLAHSPERARTDRTFRRRIFRYQGWLYFPLICFLAYSLHNKSFRAVFRGEITHRYVEGLLMCAHIAGMVTVAFVVLTPAQAIAFLLVQQAVFGFYLGNVFAPNHKGMRMYGPDDSVDYLRRQVLTSRTLRGGFLLDAAMGGLNYQIEHHLFPSMPRGNLRRAQPLVREYCAEIGLPYCETGFFESHRQTVRYLNEVGRHARPA